MAEAAAKEPSMEDILSSIRKIIADEGSSNRDEAPMQRQQQETPERQATAPAAPAQATGNPVPSTQSQAAAASNSQAMQQPLDTATVPHGHAATPGSSQIAEPQASQPSAEPSALQSELSHTNLGERPASAQGGHFSNNPGSPEVAPVPSQPPQAHSTSTNGPSLASIAEAVKDKVGTEASPARPALPRAAAISSGSTEAPAAPLSSASVTIPGAAAMAADQQSDVNTAGGETEPSAELQQPQSLSSVDIDEAKLNTTSLTEKIASEPPVQAESVASPETSVSVKDEVEPVAPEIGADGPSSEEVQIDEEAAAFKGALMSPGPDNAVSSSFDRLKRSAMDDMDAKTEAILRPMLREWLDENLPQLVEKLVREEIERVARGK